MSITAQSVPATTRSNRELKIFNDLITCKICKGYIIDATTINTCLHSFCKSCIVKHLETNKYCPKCGNICSIYLSNLRVDKKLRSIIYKIVPGLYRSETQRKQKFEKEIQEQSMLQQRRPPQIHTHQQQQVLIQPLHLHQHQTQPIVNAFSGFNRNSNLLQVANNRNNLRHETLSNIDEQFFALDDPISLSLEYYPGSVNGYYNVTLPPVKYLQCPAAMRIKHLQRFITSKYVLSDDLLTQINIIYEDELMPMELALLDVAYCYEWKRVEPMHFYYQIVVLGQKSRPENVLSIRNINGSRNTNIINSNNSNINNQNNSNSQNRGSSSNNNNNTNKNNINNSYKYINNNKNHTAHSSTGSSIEPAAANIGADSTRNIIIRVKKQGDRSNSQKQVAKKLEQCNTELKACNTIPLSDKAAATVAIKENVTNHCDSRNRKIKSNLNAKSPDHNENDVNDGKNRNNEDCSGFKFLEPKKSRTQEQIVKNDDKNKHIIKHETCMGPSTDIVSIRSNNISVNTNKQKGGGKDASDLSSKNKNLQKILPSIADVEGKMEKLSKPIKIHTVSFAKTIYEIKAHSQSSHNISDANQTPEIPLKIIESLQKDILNNNCMSLPKETKQTRFTNSEQNVSTSSDNSKETAKNVVRNIPSNKKETIKICDKDEKHSTVVNRLESLNKKSKNYANKNSAEDIQKLISNNNNNNGNDIKCDMEKKQNDRSKRKSKKKYFSSGNHKNKICTIKLANKKRNHIFKRCFIKTPQPKVQEKFVENVAKPTLETVDLTEYVRNIGLTPLVVPSPEEKSSIKVDKNKEQATDRKRKITETVDDINSKIVKQSKKNTSDKPIDALAKSMIIKTPKQTLNGQIKNLNDLKRQRSNKSIINKSLVPISYSKSASMRQIRNNHMITDLGSSLLLNNPQSHLMYPMPNNLLNKNIHQFPLLFNSGLPIGNMFERLQNMEANAYMMKGESRPVPNLARAIVPHHILQQNEIINNSLKYLKLMQGTKKQDNATQPLFMNTAQNDPILTESDKARSVLPFHSPAGPHGLIPLNKNSFEYAKVSSSTSDSIRHPKPANIVSLERIKSLADHASQMRNPLGLKRKLPDSLPEKLLSNQLNVNLQTDLLDFSKKLFCNLPPQVNSHELNYPIRIKSPVQIPLLDISKYSNKNCIQPEIHTNRANMQTTATTEQANVPTSSVTHKLNVEEKPISKPKSKLQIDNIIPTHLITTTSKPFSPVNSLDQSKIPESISETGEKRDDNLSTHQTNTSIRNIPDPSALVIRNQAFS